MLWQTTFPKTTAMLIAGLTPCSLLDFPDTLSCILFTQGCNFRCGYCHNPEMVVPSRDTTLIPWETVLAFLERRQGLLEGVVFCGGEPTLQPDLLQAMQEVRAMGFKVKLDTNGSRPDILRSAISCGLVDYVAMDYKTTPDKAEQLYKGSRFNDALQESLRCLRQSSIPYEIRTTVVREHHTAEVLQTMAAHIDGAPAWFLQPFRPSCTLDPAMASNTSYAMSELEALGKELEHTGGLPVIVRSL